MAVITVNLPTDEELELVRRFTVNRNYLQSIAGFLTGTYGHREQLYSGLKTTLDSYPSYTRINRGNADMSEVRRFLTLAWASEIQLHLPALMGNTAMLGFANAWAPVHAYYAVFWGRSKRGSRRTACPGPRTTTPPRCGRSPTR